MVDATRPDPTLTDAVSAAVERLSSSARLSNQSTEKLTAIMWQFAAFAQNGCGVRRISLITPKVARCFIDAPSSAGRRPSLPVQHLRRSALRLLFRTMRELGLDIGDPTLDLTLTSRRRAGFRPLSDDELASCRAAASSCARSAAVLAVCEATGRTGELPHVTTADVDLDERTVMLLGGRGVVARTGLLTDWGVEQMARWLSDSTNSNLVTSPRRPDEAAAQSSAVMAFARILTRAGLDDEPSVRPSSIAAWAGRAAFDATGRIEIAAARLGMRSLDRAATFIGWDWSTLG